MTYADAVAIVEGIRDSYVEVSIYVPHKGRGGRSLNLATLAGVIRDVRPTLTGSRKEAMRVHLDEVGSGRFISFVLDAGTFTGGQVRQVEDPWVVRFQQAGVATEIEVYPSA